MDAACLEAIRKAFLANSRATDVRSVEQDGRMYILVFADMEFDYALMDELIAIERGLSAKGVQYRYFGGRLITPEAVLSLGIL